MIRIIECILSYDENEVLLFVCLFGLGYVLLCFSHFLFGELTPMPGSGHGCTQVVCVCCCMGFPGSYWAMRDLIRTFHHPGSAHLWQGRCQNQFNIRGNI